MMPTAFEMNGLHTRAMRCSAVWTDILLYEQTNELAHENEATLRVAYIKLQKVDHWGPSPTLSLSFTWV